MQYDDITCLEAPTKDTTSLHHDEYTTATAFQPRKKWICMMKTTTLLTDPSSYESKIRNAIISKSFDNKPESASLLKDTPIQLNLYTTHQPHASKTTSNTTTDSSSTTQSSEEEVLSSVAQVLTDAFSDSPVYQSLLQPISDNPEQCKAIQQYINRKRLNLWSNNSWCILHVTWKEGHETNSKSSSTTASSSSSSIGNSTSLVLEVQLIGHICVQLPQKGKSKSIEMGIWKLVKAGFFMIPFIAGWSITRRLFRLMDEFEIVQQNGLASYHDMMNSTCSPPPPPPDVAVDKDRDCANISKEGDEGSTAIVQHARATIEAFVIAPSYQQQGIGNAVLTHILHNLVDSVTPSIATLLFTQEEHNVKFYERHGFVTVDQSDIQLQDPTLDEGDSTSASSSDGSGYTKDVHTFPNWVMIRKPNNLQSM